MPTSVATHASLLLKAAAAKPFFSPRAAARIPPPPPPHHPPSPPRAPAAAAGRFLPTTKATTAGAGAVGVSRWFRWQSARGLCAAPDSAGAFYMDGPWAATATTGIFLAAAVTDWLDGYLARKMQLGTPFGAFLDPVADKITMSAVREWAASQNSKVLEAVAVNNLGKWKTATQMTALTLLLASRDPSLPVQGALVIPGVALLYVSAGLAIWSLVVYMRKIWRILLK
ncbi:Cardiolipin synthase (CMP-forming), mitochondrial [Dichanthelium oligosanthes]|uniref:Cardiolipin synthase (CMP-forming), mitochondrial n=1 Tax=Dichanthelium oligosanthes TaxID=888268 RepID=A0A1E5W5Z7_9POAL|nr:Cardiolipin synthase (CMP-forming), mitochondrial [Dichanthelium oligosanthes]